MKIRSSLLLLVLIASLVLSACAVAPTTPAATSAEEAVAEAPAEEAAAEDAAPASDDIRISTSGYQGVLNYWVLGYTPGNQFAVPMEVAVEAFEAANPGIDVELVGYPPNDEGFTKLNTAVQTGQGVDVLRLPSDRLLAFVADGLIAPAEDYMTEADLADFYPNVLDVVRLQDNKAMAWPLWVVPMGMYLNTDVFAERGVELPSKEWTWEEFIDVAKQLTFTRDNGEQVYGWSGFVDPGVVNTWPLFMNGGESIRPVVDGKFGFDSPEAIEAIQRYADMALVDKITPLDFGAMADADVKGGFTNGQLAMVIDATGPAAQFAADGVNFEIYPIPTVGDNETVTIGAVGLIAVVAQEDEARVQAGMDLARYLTSAEVQEDVPPTPGERPVGFYLAPGARASVQVAPPLDEFLPFLPYMYVTPILESWSEITRIIHPALQNVIFGEQTAEEAMTEIAPDINALLEEEQ